MVAIEQRGSFVWRPEDNKVKRTVLMIDLDMSLVAIKTVKSAI